MHSTHTRHWSGRGCGAPCQHAPATAAGRTSDSRAAHWLKALALLPFQIVLTLAWCVTDLMFTCVLLIVPVIGLASLLTGGVFAIAVTIRLASVIVRTLGLF